jgi:hypothetical protein
MASSKADRISQAPTGVGLEEVTDPRPPDFPAGDVHARS